MARRFFGFAAAAAAVVVAAACNETPPSAPQDAPSFGKAVSPNACLFTGNPSLSNSAGAYFLTNVDRKAAADLITAMQDGYAASGTAGARDAGYSLLALTGAASRDPARAGSIDIGETMVKQAVNCMYDTKNTTDFSGWPDDGQYDFSAALDAPNGGAFFVRGGTTDPSGPAVGNLASLNTGADPAAGNVSGMAPPDQKTWADILANNSQKRILIYGEPVPDGFDWKLIGRNSTFSPFVVVALCQGVHPGQEFNAADVIFQESVGSLGVQPNAICGTLPSSFALGGYGRGGFGLVSRFVAMAGRMLTPEPLHATTLATTIGGSASGAKKDEFTVLNLPTVNLKFTVQPPRRPKVNQRFPITVDVTTPAGDPAGGITVTLSTTTNNGTGTAVYAITSEAPSTYAGCSPKDNPSTGLPWVVVPVDTTLNTVDTDGTTAATVAHWDKVCFTKTGNVQIVATSQAAGNTAAGNATKLSTNSNVDP
jgi:hypothetical protein